MSGTRYLRPGDRLTLVRREPVRVLTEPCYVLSVDDAHVTLTATDAGTIQWGGAVVDVTYPDEDPDDAA